MVSIHQEKLGPWYSEWGEPGVISVAELHNLLLEMQSAAPTAWGKKEQDQRLPHYTTRMMGQLTTWLAEHPGRKFYRLQADQSLVILPAFWQAIKRADTYVHLCEQMGIGFVYRERFNSYLMSLLNAVAIIVLNPPSKPKSRIKYE